jgi:crotonobetainyl-CoA:carnitine CoA-transferase CaiB-like acyl-CoA transferase
VIERPELAKDPRFSTIAEFYTKESRKDLTTIFDETFKKHPVEYWHKLLDEHDLPHEPVRHMKDVPYDPQVVANHYTYFHEYSDGVKTVFTNGPVHFSSIDPAYIPCKTSGKIGCDTDEVLKENGYTEEEVKKMQEAGEVI